MRNASPEKTPAEVAKLALCRVLSVLPLASAYAGLAFGPKNPGGLAGYQLGLTLRLESTGFRDVDSALLCHERRNAPAYAAADRTEGLAIFGV